MSTEAPKGKGPERERRPIPLTVLSIICRYLQLDNAQGTLLSVLLTSRNSYEVTIPHLYKDVYITEEGLGSLVKGLHRQEDKPFDRWPIGDELFLGYSPSDPPINQAQRRARMQKYYTDMLKDYKLPTIALENPLDLTDYPNTASHRRKIASMARATRVVILDVPYGASLDDFYVLAWTSVKPLFPLVTDLVIGPVIGEVYFDSIFSDGYGPIGDRDPLRILREAVSQACSPINICVRGHPTSLADHQLRMDYLTGPQVSSPYQPYFDKKTIMEVVLGRVENFSTHDAVYHLPQAILLGSNRYFFSCCPYDFCICHENTSDDRILRLSRLWFMLSELTVDLENTTFRFIDLGRTHSSDTRAVVEAASRQALGDSLDEALCDSLGRATDSDDPEDDPPHLIIEQRLTEIFRRIPDMVRFVGDE
ncbi:hypothetical protein DB88DRAFT_539663 [Papiliotrema laurentii]|uniref:Uncharacterized protein n=1 Tax=Papiliotrema laurentii TaxID=5418 RepID=A0AAD9FRJ1_PAPLA|nr:hypothetical protein DB88DRAFT_539663 [Papiliotrema laurentii]